jgi:hypothetical protein
MKGMEFIVARLPGKAALGRLAGAVTTVKLEIWMGLAFEIRT